MSLRRANAALKPSLFARELLLEARRENISRATLISSFLLNAAEKNIIISKFQKHLHKYKNREWTKPRVKFSAINSYSWISE